MKNITIKMLLLVLSVLLLAAFFTGCTKKPASAEENTEPQVVFSTPRREIDLNGYTVKIAQWWDGSPKDRMSIERHRAAEEKFNCKIEYVTIAWDQIVSKFTSSVLSGEPIADIILFEMTKALPVFAESDLIIPVDDYFNFNHPKWPSIIKQTGRYAGKQYGFTNASWNISGIYYNKVLFDRLGLPDPYVLQENGEWTWEKFLEIAQKATGDEDGDGQNDRWGLVIQGHNLYAALVLSNNANIINIDDYGKATFALDDPNAIEALQFFGDLHNKYKVVAPVMDSTDWYEAPREFSKGNVAMFFGQGWDGQDLKTAMKDDFGFVFLPKGPKASDYIVPVQQECKIYVMPKYAKHPKEVAKVFEEIFPFYNDMVGFEYWIAEFLDSTEEKATVRKMLEKGKVSMHQGYPTFDNLLFKKVTGEIIDKNVPAEIFIKDFKDEAQRAIDSEY
ncbi:ABC transporter substrate-binding protein [Acetivibrio straminisolvens]|uniref:Extracellular solute-binding protein n=1 Tax=Acetivibrio straminisolvens JCM 21531 TaxID=1294263 RepID=W4V2M5_9FIRM|nr:extracellular solute-binding protein [Acetivibrio straminisolvens]GAE87436.1 extracellular solute-binding protein [Acetivibrio straminisolvens JCM 21531]